MVFRNDYIFFRVETYFGLPPLPAQESVGRPRRPKRKKKPNHLRREKEVFLLPPLPTLLPSPPLLNVKNWRRKEERKKSGQSGEKKGTFKRNKEKRAKIGLVWETVVCANWPRLEFFFTETEAVSGIGSRSEDFQKKRNPKSRTKKTRKSRNKRVFRRRRTLVWDSKKTAVKMTTKSRKREKKDPLRYKRDKVGRRGAF